MPDLSVVECGWHEATPAQQGLWILDQIDRLRPSYLLPSVVEFGGPLDHPALVASVARTLGRHPALRSRFRLDLARRRVEYRTDGAPGEVGLVDAVAEGWSAPELDRLVEAVCYTPFDLAAEAPARAEVIRVDASTTLLVLTVHHIVFDGISRQVVMADIAEDYQSTVEGRAARLSTPVHPAGLPGPQSREELAGRVAEVVERLRGAPTDVELPYDGDRDASDASMIGAGATTELGEELTARVLATAAREGCTAFMTGVALLAGTLARWGKQRDFLFAVVWPGRDDPATAQAVGMFMSTLILRVRLDDGTSWRDLLRAARAGAMDAFVDADVPLDAIAAALDSDRDVGRPPVTPVLVNMAETPGTVDLGGLVGRYRPLRPQYSKWDLALFVGLAGDPGHGRLELGLDYPADLFHRTTVTDVLAALRRSAADLALSPEEPVLKPETDESVLNDPTARLELVRSIWREVLATDEVADDVSFFDAGGDSMRLVILVERLGQASGRAIRTVDLFRAGTVRGQADLLVTAAARTGAAQAGTAAQPSGRDRLLRAARGGDGQQPA
jgi:aryl carrier-like protein